MLPTVIQHIIYEYRIEFERVEREIDRCLEKYYDIEEKVVDLRSRIANTDLCSYHTESVNMSLTHTLQEAGRIVDRILDTESVNPVQLMMLKNLENEILIDIFNIVCHPFMLYPATM